MRWHTRAVQLASSLRVNTFACGPGEGGWVAAMLFRNFTLLLVPACRPHAPVSGNSRCATSAVRKRYQNVPQSEYAGLGLAATCSIGICDKSKGHTTMAWSSSLALVARVLIANQKLEQSAGLALDRLTYCHDLDVSMSCC